MIRKSLVAVLVLMAIACKKNADKNLRYFEVGITDATADWRDSSFIIATANQPLISQVRAQLNLPINERKIINGALKPGNSGYNKNASHQFKWHFDEGDWHLTDFSIEIYDGRAHSDIDNNIDYWIDTVKRFSPWNSYIKREVSP